MSRTDLDTHRQCPECKTVIVALEARGDAAVDPSAMVCGACGRVLTTDADGTLRLMSSIHFNALGYARRVALAASQRAILARNLLKQNPDLNRPRGPREAPKHDTKTVYED